MVLLLLPDVLLLCADLVAVVFNGALMYTLYQLKYKPLLFSGRARMDKIKRVETYAKVCYFFKFFRLI